MLEGHLPKIVDPRRLAKQSVSLKGRWPVADLEQLANYLTNTEGEVEADLNFSQDAEGHFVISGQLTAQVQMTCQRCLEPVSLSVTSDILLAVVWSDESGKQLPDNLDPIVVADEHLSLARLIDEELILNLPIVPAHEDPVCQPQMEWLDPDAEDDSAVSEQPKNPFAVLASLKKSKT
ncbi:YceD family protein [Spartinivicinus poritis]|uniref:Large ribosomal RNA subunit accumulation protein YceD n=1 Tax=Spartinivicinus poritis TaxID=2994640 RepID=A0ABT5U8C3_9GAMM|nr:YceD family protein [Spartinivicinus sp. A2-2]MDE1462623.1 YceD family protein [Spartinivicinus sp. A2-2]